MSDMHDLKGSSGKGLPQQAVSVDQHSLGYSIALHLLPGATMTIIMLAAPLVRGWGFPVIFALFLGILLVIAPIELGYLLYQAKRTTGRWSLAGVVSYRQKLPMRKYALLGGGLAAWWIVVLFAMTTLLDEWIAQTLFWWVPESVLTSGASLCGHTSFPPQCLW